LIIHDRCQIWQSPPQRILLYARLCTAEVQRRGGTAFAPPHDVSKISPQVGQISRCGPSTDHLRSNLEKCREQSRQHMARLHATQTDSQRQKHRDAQRVYREQYDILWVTPFNSFCGHLGMPSRLPTRHAARLPRRMLRWVKRLNRVPKADIITQIPTKPQTTRTRAKAKTGTGGRLCEKNICIINGSKESRPNQNQHPNLWLATRQ
jgi:hypothetical protein